MAEIKCAKCEYGDWNRYSGKECKECSETSNMFKPMTKPRKLEPIYIGHRE